MRFFVRCVWSRYSHVHECSLHVRRHTTICCFVVTMPALVEAMAPAPRLWMPSESPCKVSYVSPPNITSKQNWSARIHPRRPGTNSGPDLRARPTLKKRQRCLESRHVSEHTSKMVCQDGRPIKANAVHAGLHFWVWKHHRTCPR